MFITRATRHDHADIKELLTTRGWEDADLKEGEAYVARQGAIVGCIRLVEVAPQTLVLDDVLVHEDKRGTGLGRALMEATLNAKGGTLYLCCHDDVIPFYAKFGFAVTPLEDTPAEVQSYWVKVGDIPSDDGHEHFFMTAR